MVRNNPKPVCYFKNSFQIPKLGIISDVSPEATVSGQLLLYRLLREYPGDLLTVVEGNVWPSDKSKRLKGVDYSTVSYVFPRLFRTRLYAYWNLALVWGIHLLVSHLTREMQRRRVQAILTVAHGHLWMAAAKVAERLRVPLHLIVHDDWSSTLGVPSHLGLLVESRFQRVYSMAASRLCVSPYMEEEYRRRFGVAGSVLWPCRGEDSPEGRLRLRSCRESFVAAYAGSLPNSGYVQLLRQAGTLLQEMGGRLDLYTNATPGQLTTGGLNAPNVRACGFLPPHLLAEQIGQTADVLLLPMSFAETHQGNMAVCFPSKLVEYTAIGLPIVIWGPPYCSAVRWAKDHPGAAAAVCDPDPQSLKEVFLDLSRNRTLGHQLAHRAVDLGNRLFSLEEARALFTESLSLKKVAS